MVGSRWLAIRLVAMGATLVICAAQEQAVVRASEQGMASWYGPSFNGQVSASGEVYNSGEMTAAHRTLPFGTKVRVRRLDTEESVDVRFNDRVRLVDWRVVGVCLGAGRLLGLTDPGVVEGALGVVESAEAEG